ncbi:retrovirus-related pol polyprotein from transposon TNT 1-94 [Tanacetum coccineum]
MENADLKGQIQELQNELRRLKGKNVLDNASTIIDATTISPRMFKLDIEPISHRLKNNKDPHEDYLKKTIENTDTIRGLVEHARKHNPSEPLLDTACVFTKCVQELLVYVSKTCPILTKSSEKLVVVTPKNKYKKVSKKHSHKPKAKDSIQEKLYLLHMDLCGPIRIQSINGRKYILVIVDDYSWFTWVKFLQSKDEVPEFVIKFLKMIQVRLNGTIRNIRTDNGTEIVNQTLRAYYEEIRISHQTSVARTSQHNGVVERWNRTLVEVARTMSIFSKALLFLWVEAVATAFFRLDVFKLNFCLHKHLGSHLQLLPTTYEGGRIDIPSIRLEYFSTSYRNLHEIP